ncbi:MAG: cell envelope biogenesis protein TolA [Archangium sp.]|nr:cell envelope biogenesis protein TolA [Archangium sp.]
MTPVIILLGIALAISLAFNLGFIGGGAKPSAQAAANTSSSSKSETRSDDDRARKLEAELDKKKRELEEVKKAQAELKDDLKATKKKLHDQRENEKSGDDLVKARAEVERTASIQLEATRAELATALADIQKLKTQADNKNKPRPAVAAEPTEKKEEVKAEKPQEVITRVIRELSDVEKERIAKLEASSSTDRKKANELDRELKSLKAKLDRHQRDSKRVYQEADLARDKFRAVEVRLNRTLVENDLLKRAIKDLEKKSGVEAGRLELNAEEIATSDSAVKAKFAAEDAAEADARAKLEAAPATHLEEPAAPAADATPAPAETPAPAATPTAQA